MSCQKTKATLWVIICPRHRLRNAAPSGHHHHRRPRLRHPADVNGIAHPLPRDRTPCDPAGYPRRRITTGHHPPCWRRQSIPGASSQMVPPGTPQSRPHLSVSDTPSRHGAATVEVWRNSLVLRSYSARIPLVFRLYTRANLSRPSVSPPTTGLALTTPVWRLFKGIGLIECRISPIRVDSRHSRIASKTSEFCLDPAGAHEAPAADCFVQGKRTRSHERETKPPATLPKQQSRDDQRDTPHRARDPPAPVDIPSKEVPHDKH